MTTFEQRIKDAAESSIIKMFANGEWVMPNYQGRVQIPGDFMEDVWRLVDRDKLKRQIAERIESEMADRIVNFIAAEITTDVKQILSVKERREAIRALAREHMVAIMAAGQEGI